jgi:hypothetical protein
MADPAYKPFMGQSINGSDKESLYSSLSAEKRSMKSEDASPERRQMMRSPNKTHIKNSRRRRSNRIERLLEESDLLDSHLKSQLDQIHEIRK